MNISELKEDFINLTKTRAISAEGAVFEIGDNVKHEGASEDEIGIINSFEINEETNDVIANTNRGSGRISFMYHP